MSSAASARSWSSGERATTEDDGSLLDVSGNGGPLVNDASHNKEPQPFRSRIEYTSPLTVSRISPSPASTARTVSRPSIARSMRSRSRAVTPSILGPSESHEIICAISEARDVSPSVGIAFLNITLGEVVLSQIQDNQSYVKTIHKIQIANPSRIIFPSTVCPPNQPGTLYLLIQDLFGEVPIVSLPRSAWSEDAGQDHLHSLGIESEIEPIKVAIHGKSCVLPCFAATMSYIEDNFDFSFAPHSLRIRYKPSDDTMMIDISAIQSLEIMQNARKPKSKDSLFGLLNQTLTPMGSRMLRNNVLQPLTSREAIELRHAALEDLMSHEEMFRDIRKVLKMFHDTEKLLTKLIIIPAAVTVSELDAQITHVLMIKSFLEAVPELYNALGPARSNLLVRGRDMCRPEITVPSLSNITRVLQADVRYSKSPLDLRNQRTFAVKSDISGMLDVARMAYKEVTQEIHEYVDGLNGEWCLPGRLMASADASEEEYRLGAMLKYDNGRKYWLRIRKANIEDDVVPEVLINVVGKRDALECQTLDLVKLNRRLAHMSNEVVKLSDAIIQGLIKDLRGVVPDLFEVCESVALIDMLASFVQLATTRDYVRPEIGNVLALKAARHPILDKTMSSTFVPNDYFASENFGFHIVTGCNMSGKSTYIRAIALLQIMAQIGSFVPAEYASFTVMNSIFARVSMDDRVEENLSTFSVEMREMAFILQNMDERSLAIIDELGRGTGTKDGLAIVIAMSEALIGRGASVWFATHFVELARVFENHQGVLKLHLECETTDTNGMPQLIMRYKATEGTVDAEEYYGINLARAIGMPAHVVQRAQEVAKDLRERRKADRANSESAKVMVRRKLTSTLYETLRQAMESGSEETLQSYLQQLQKDYIERMAEVDML